MQLCLYKQNVGFETMGYSDIKRQMPSWHNYVFPDNTTAEAISRLSVNKLKPALLVKVFEPVQVNP